MLAYVNCKIQELPDCDCGARTANDEHLPDCPFGQELLRQLGRDCEIVKTGDGLGHTRKVRTKAA